MDHCLFLAGIDEMLFCTDWPFEHCFIIVSYRSGEGVERS